jgi:hypothetical protein
MTTVLDAIRQAKAAVSAVSWIETAGVSDEDLVAFVTETEALGRIVDSARAFAAGEIADRSRYELGAEGLSMRYSQRKPVDFIEQVTRVSKSEAARRVRIGLAIRGRQSLLGEQLPPEHPILAEATAHGVVGLDSAHTILYSLKQAATGSEATPDNLDAAELALVQLGTTDSADTVADIGRVWRDALDPDGIEPRYEEIRERRIVTIGRERNGIKKYTINAAPPLSAVLDAALEESMDPKVGPRFLSEAEQAAAPVELVETSRGVIERVVDPRSLGQKQYDILESVFGAGLRATRDGAPTLRTVGSVTAVVQLKDLEAGTGFGILEGTDEVIPASAIQELACDAGFHRVVVDSRGRPLHHGMIERYFTESQRRAMIARDGDRCVAKGCRKRAAACHAHHVIFFSHGGATDIDNGVLLCPAHHHALHQGAFEVRMVDGLPWIRESVDRFDDDAWWPASRNRLLLARAV